MWFMIAKILRKLGLGHAAYALAAPLFFMKYGETEQGADVQAALELLHETSPDPCSSCYIPPRESRCDESEAELDVIIPAYNVEDFIIRCLDSVTKQQTGYSFRVLAIDDGSTDSTGSILDCYEGITVIHQKNRGLSGARNTGLEHATAEYVLFLDSDDELCEGAIEKLMSAARANDAAIVEGSYTEVDLSGRTIRRHSHHEGPMKATELSGFSCFKVFKQSLFDSLVFPKAYWYEDSIMRQIVCPLAIRNGLPVVGIRDSVAFYRQNPRGITRQSRGRSKCLDSLYITMQLFKDREKYGFPLTPEYYDYILHMAVQTWSRIRFQSDEVQRAVFTVYADFVERSFTGFRTEDRKLAALEKAIHERDYGRYLAYCRLH